ncbi:DUF1129 family protein [Bacillus niameyensis]|uniref:DUF1129 family protein n=1 Tax=Bacillus niameyensis TaxID=1522308 RepID=UPI000780A39B|nr:DUF1129 family protein [Bacillus niameyensis]
MLSKKSESFIENLRMYLMTSGKNEQEVKELTEELTVHLLEAEKSGKSIDHIIHGSPEEYMESLRAEMTTDYRKWMKMIPIFLLGTMAYLFMGPAIRGEFELNVLQIIGFPIAVFLGLIVYIVGLRRAGKKQYSLKKLFIFAMVASITTTTLFIVVLLGSTLLVDPFFQASPFVNGLMIVACALIFIGLALWSKTWFSIWIPGILFIPDIVLRFSNMDAIQLIILSAGSFILLFVLMIAGLIIKGKRSAAGR